MKTMNIRGFAALAVRISVLLVAMLFAATPGSAADVRAAANSGDANARLDALVDEYFETQLKRNPLFATYIGDDRYDDRFPDTSSEAWWTESRALEKRWYDAARRIDARRLDAEHRLTWDVFMSDRRTALAGERFPKRLLPLDQFNSLATEFAVIGSGAGAQPFHDARDYDRFLSRAREWVVWMDSALAAFRDGMQRGVTLPRAVAAKIVPQMRDLAVADPERSVFWQPIRNFPDTVSAADRARLAEAYRRAIAEQILPAYRRLADFVEKEYLPRARESVAWTALPDGRAWYAQSIREQTTTRITPERAHQLGLAEVARIHGEMEAVMKQVGFQGDLHAFFRFLADDPQFYYTSGSELVQGYQDVKKRIDALLPKLFSDFPKAPYEVREVEAFRAASSAGAFYQGPSADGSRPGIFYVNTYNLKAQPKFGMETLSIHEAAPGHHFQIAIAQELTDLPKFRRFGGYGAYSEGWALYCESIGKELGAFTDPYQWYGRLSDEMLRAMRLVVDTGLHAKGWTREQAIDYMLANSSMARSDVEAEVERYIVWPGQALSYKLGQFEISRLRAKAEKTLGAAFDVREFHSQVLRGGALPLDVLAAKIDRWIVAKKAATGGAGGG